MPPDRDIERLPPHNKEAEKGVLGSLLRDNRLIPDLVQLLRARGIYFELQVIPDDLHESMLHRNWVTTFNHMGDFLRRFVWNKESAATTDGDRQK